MRISDWSSDVCSSDLMFPSRSRTGTAIDEAGFEFVYQPIVAVQGGEEAQFQCLLRLRDSAGIVHQAAAIVAVAERRGWMSDVDRWAVSVAVAVIAHTQAPTSTLRLFLTPSPVHPIGRAAGRENESH